MNLSRKFSCQCLAQLGPELWLLILVCFSFIPNRSCAQTSEPIWINSQPEGIPTEAVFRRQFTLIRPESGEIEIISGRIKQIFVNDKQAIIGNSEPGKIDVSDLLTTSVNTIAVLAISDEQNSGFNLRLRIKEKGESRWRVLGTNRTWKASSIQSGWQSRSYRDDHWSLAELVSADYRPATEEAPRFKIAPGFVVEEVFNPEETGSLIALDFNEFGKLLLSQEGGPLLMADPDRPVDHPRRIWTYCDKVTSCQGILALNGNVYVTGMGPQGLGLYLLKDEARDGTIDKIEKLVSFTGNPGEHGPHAIQLGLDGMLYVILGNGTQVADNVSDSSPYRVWYEGDLVPRYEDPGGHATGIKAPGGTLIRVAVDGSKVERIAGGIRNAYDFVFDAQGNLFIHDSDMESDEGAPWYRPNTIYYVPTGGEFGWRSGWSNFPSHVMDQVPLVTDTGRGSPTGAVSYQHFIFPTQYHNSIFFADWSEGEILVLRPKASGAGFVGQTEVFLSGKPLNVCDLTVGEDGSLYFCTGGRGTSGGVFRAVYTGEVAQQFLNFENDLVKVIRHPQPNSAWARQSIAELKLKLGDQWQNSLQGVIFETRNPSRFRCRALQLMLLYGTPPGNEMLAKLHTDRDEMVRAEVARICGLLSNDSTEILLAKLLNDVSPTVRRNAGESYLRLNLKPELASVKKLLSSTDRIEAMIGRRLLEGIASEEWESELIQAENLRIFLNAALVLMTAEPTLQRSYNVLAQCSIAMDGYLSDPDFIDLLRVVQLALIRGKVEPEKVPGLVDRIGNEFPSGSSIVNQELARLMAYLKIGSLEGRIEHYLASDSIPLNDRLHAAMYLQFIGSNLPSKVRLAIIECLESSRTNEISAGLKMYLKRAVEDAAKSLTPAEMVVVLERGAQWPNAAVSAFYKLPEKLEPETRQTIFQLDQELQNRSDAASNQLRLGVIALLARDGDPESMEYLRKLWIAEVGRRGDIAIGLAQQPEADNWPYLVSSLPHLDDLTGREIVQILREVDRKPLDGVHFRELIELGFRMRTNGALDAVKLLEHWVEVTPKYDAGDWQTRLNAWIVWLKTEFPDEPAVAQRVENPGRYQVEEIVSFLEKQGLGDRSKGLEFFTTTQCANCHRVGNIGQNVGPDLTNLAQRFSLREIVEATIDPSATIPDRYRSKVVLTIDGDQHTGMAIAQSDGGYLILRSDGNRIKIPKDDIEDVRESDVSAMPEGLLDELSLSQIADLMAFLMQQKDQMAQGATMQPLPGENR